MLVQDRCKGISYNETKKLELNYYSAPLDFPVNY